MIATTVNTLRMWSARSPHNNLDFSAFSAGNYVKALANRDMAAVISKVLYPEDNQLSRARNCA